MSKDALEDTGEQYVEIYQIIPMNVSVNCQNIGRVLHLFISLLLIIFFALLYEAILM